MPTAMERLIWGFGDGQHCRSFDTPLGRIGAVICWENYMPLLRMAMYGKGIQLYCAPTVDDRDTWAPACSTSPSRGAASCFRRSSTCRERLSRGLSPRNWPRATSEVVIRGGSVIVNPLGRILAGPSFDGECILTADLDLDEIVEGKYDFDVAGHYSRPDIFGFEVRS